MTLAHGRRLNDRMHGDNHRGGQAVDQIENVDAIIAAKNPKLVLDRDHINAQKIEAVSGLAVIGLDLLSNTAQSRFLRQSFIII